MSLPTYVLRLSPRSNASPCTCIYVCMYICVCIDVCIYVCVCLCVDIYIYIYILTEQTRVFMWVCVSYRNISRSAPRPNASPCTATGYRHEMARFRASWAIPYASCVCIYICVCMYIHTHLYMNTYKDVCIYVYTHTDVCVCI